MNTKPSCETLKPKLFKSNSFEGFPKSNQTIQEIYKPLSYSFGKFVLVQTKFCVSANQIC